MSRMKDVAIDALNGARVDDGLYVSGAPLTARQLAAALFVEWAPNWLWTICKRLSAPVAPPTIIETAQVITARVYTVTYVTDGGEYGDYFVWAQDFDGARESFYSRVFNARILRITNENGMYVRA